MMAVVCPSRVFLMAWSVSVIVVSAMVGTIALVALKVHRNDPRGHCVMASAVVL